MKVRLDLYISAKYPNITRSQAKRLIEEGNVLIRGVVCEKPSHTVHESEEVVLNLPPPKESRLVPQNIPLDILFEDADIIVVNKPAGLTVHPGAGRQSETLVNALLFHCKDLSGIGGEVRPGIVHRLDKDTSGIMVVAKNDNAHVKLSDQFKSRTVDKKYLALVYGKIPKDEGTITAQIGRSVSDRKKMSTKTRKGRTSETIYTVVKRFENFLTLVDIKLATGRTHQIRVHFAHIGHPLVGDSVYGGAKAGARLKDTPIFDVVKPFARQALHSYRLSFDHPVTGKRMTFEAGMPDDMEMLINDINQVQTF